MTLRLKMSECLLSAFIVTAPAATAAISIYVSPPGDITSAMANVSKEENFSNAPSSWSDLTQANTVYNAPSGIGSYTQVTGGFGDVYTMSDIYGIDESPYVGIGGSNASLSLQLAAPVQYFGFAWSAGDADNEVYVYRNNVLLFTLDTDDIVDFVDFLPKNKKITALDGKKYKTKDYYGQPAFDKNGKLKKDRVNDGETYVYIHIISDDANQLFDRIEFKNIVDSGAFETDNHAIVNAGLDVAPHSSFILVFQDAEAALGVPEPAVYPLMLGLASLAIVVARRRQRSA